MWKLCANWDFLINNEGNAVSKKQSIRTEFTVGIKPLILDKNLMSSKYEYE